MIHPAIWPQQIWAENWRGSSAPFGEGELGPHLTMWSGAPRSTCMPSFILIRPTVWPQYTNVTYIQDRQDRQQSDSIGRTVLQTVAQSQQVLSSSWDGRPFGHSRMGQKVGSCAPFRGELGVHLTQCRLGRGQSPYWHHPSGRLSITDMSRKLGAVPPF